MAKRMFDIAVALSGMLIFLPLFVLAAFLVLLSMGRPILFRQERLGYKERTFYILKFRTMLDVTGPDGRLLPDIERITPIGSFLRRTSLDELPQLWNVIKGDMSLVGPRPLYPHYLPYYTDRERKRHLVRPGITGLAQVNGRNDLSWDERLELDVQYVEHQSFWLDIRIIVATVSAVFRQKGVIVIPGVVQSPLDVCRKSDANE